MRDAAPEADYIVYPSTARLAGLAALAACLGGMGVWIVLSGWGATPGPRGLGALIGGGTLAAFSTLVLAALLRRIASPRPTLRLDRRGLIFGDGKRAIRVEFSEVASVSVLKVGRQRMLTVVPRDPAALKARLTPLLRALLRADAAVLGYEALTLPRSMVDRGLEEIAEEIGKRAGLAV